MGVEVAVYSSSEPSRFWDVNFSRMGMRRWLSPFISIPWVIRLAASGHNLVSLFLIACDGGDPAAAQAPTVVLSTSVPREPATVAPVATVTAAKASLESAAVTPEAPAASPAATSTVAAERMLPVNARGGHWGLLVLTWSLRG